MKRQPPLEGLVETICCGRLVAMFGRTTSGQREARQIASQKRNWDRTIAQPKEPGIEEHDAASS